ncbi:Ig-like domain-containing protein [Flavobacterium lacus]|uniref:Gliding motility-associated-like protein n=1 Tax=Flavobacterium lacus TaxID=1353778 RepID=A0A328WWT1_9FLAO|nr:T9SS type B sorting domain-containing protein [Flavobacterium lacus]RAR47758.1 gliding motility-associated-like protein [Flavobacterium lacus]
MNSLSVLRLTLVLVAACVGFLSNWVNPKISEIRKENSSMIVNDAPILMATGNQIYCPGSQLNIVTNMSITDNDDTGIDAIYIQISSGYVNGQDVLTLTGTHPTIATSWDALTGKLTLTGISAQPTYANLIAAIEDVVYSNSSANPAGVRTFSITVGQANYLPSNGHYYEFVPAIGITWNNARTAAANRTYYGLQGYLATITAADEAQLSGEQAAGAGWIGGSDEATEGVWRWMTGPENGLIFWNGGVNGTTPNYANWNNGEPNNLGDENYAHITALGVGITGSWNDLSNTGEASGDYQPKGYIVEYGGMPGDPVLQISTSTTITIPSIISFVAQSRCGEGSVTLTANASAGTVKWYTTPTGGTPIANGNSFTTPNLTQTTTYYFDAFAIGCTSGTRTTVNATINQIPLVTVVAPNPVCGENSTVLTASTTAGTINWYSAETGGTSLGSGNTFTTPILSEDTTFYVEAINNGCSSGNRIAVDVFVYDLPAVEDETITLCEGTVITLNAGVSNATYLWSTGETSQSIQVNNNANYSVVVTSLAAGNCSKTKNFTIVQYDIPVIETVVVKDTSVEIIVSGNGEYEYSIDGFTYQDSNIFTVGEGGLYTAYVREKINNCGYSDEVTFVVLLVPPFFTPNGDGINDVFYLKGMAFYPNSSMSIFNRYGKLIKQITPSNPFWDGTFEGENLPADDYWYVLKIDNATPERKGHFSLKR